MKTDLDSSDQSSVSETRQLTIEIEKSIEAERHRSLKRLAARHKRLLDSLNDTKYKISCLQEKIKESKDATHISLDELGKLDYSVLMTTAAVFTYHELLEKVIAGYNTSDLDELQEEHRRFLKTDELDFLINLRHYVSKYDFMKWIVKIDSSGNPIIYLDKDVLLKSDTFKSSRSFLNSHNKFFMLDTIISSYFEAVDAFGIKAINEMIPFDDKGVEKYNALVERSNTLRFGHKFKSADEFYDWVQVLK